MISYLPISLCLINLNNAITMITYSAPRQIPNTSLRSGGRRREMGIVSDLPNGTHNFTGEKESQGYQITKITLVLEKETQMPLPLLFIGAEAE